MAEKKSQAELRKVLQPVGFVRDGWPELWGWAEVVAASDGRHHTAVRQMRGDHPDDFPVPVVVTSATPVYVAEEIREFFAKHPRSAIRLSDDDIRSIQTLVIDEGKSHQAVAHMFGVNVNTVGRHARAPRI